MHIVLGLIVSGSCFAETWTVDDDGKADFDSIQQAIYASSDGDSIHVQPGHYYEHISFLGKEITVLGVGGPSVTIIDAAGTLDTTVVFASGETASSILNGFTITGGNSPIDGGGVYISGCSPTILNCLIIDNVSEGNGGGIYCVASESSINECTIQNNESGDGEKGGGIYIFGGSPTITNCNFTENFPWYIHGEQTLAHFDTVLCYDESSALSRGVLLEYSFSTWTNCSFTTLDPEAVNVINSLGDTFTNCLFQGFAGHSSAALEIRGDIADGYPIIDSCIFNNNTAVNVGGAIYVCDNASPIIKNSQFNGNNATSNVGGGAIYMLGNAQATLIENCTFNNNNSAIYGGALACQDTQVTIVDCEFSYNSAAEGGAISITGAAIVQISDSSFHDNHCHSGSGGAILLEGVGSTLIGNDCLFESNEAGYSGGAINLLYGNAQLEQCDFFDNHLLADTRRMGGAISVSNEATLIALNCLLHGNSGGFGGAIGVTDYPSDDTLELTNCLFQDNQVAQAHNDGNGEFGIASGGALYLNGTNSEIIGCSFINNATIYDKHYHDEYQGGAMFITETQGNISTNIDNCTFVSNNSVSSGGAIAVHFGSWSNTVPLTIKNTNIDNNVGYRGGGIYLQGGESIVGGAALIQNVSITNNTGGGRGGGFCAVQSSAQVLDSQITGNATSGADGGAGVNLLDCSGLFSFENIIFRENTTGGGGGGIQISQCEPESIPFHIVFNNCLFEDNSANSGGGVAAQDSHELFFIQCDFDNNWGTDGGGVYEFGSVNIYENCNFINNTGINGGGLASIATGSDYLDCTFENNHTSNNGGGMFGQDFYGSLEGSIFEFNGAHNGGGLWLNGGTLFNVEIRNCIANLGGGLYTYNDGTVDDVTLQNCLICGCEPDWIEGSWIDGTGNDFPINCPNNCPGDYDSDGNVNVIDLLGAIGDWGPCDSGSPCPSDFNFDGIVNVTDILVIIASWGPCE